MKKTVKLLALICALVMLVSLAACGEKKDDTSSKSGENTAEAETEAPASNLTDYEWIKFEMPEGWADAKESDSYVTIREEADSDHVVKFFSHSYVTTKDLAEIVEKDASYDTERYHVGETFDLNGRKYYPEYFKFNDNDSVTLYVEIDADHYCEISVFEMTETAEPIKTILNSMEFDTTKL